MRVNVFRLIVVASVLWIALVFLVSFWTWPSKQMTVFMVDPVSEEVRAFHQLSVQAIGARLGDRIRESANGFSIILGRGEKDQWISNYGEILSNKPLPFDLDGHVLTTLVTAAFGPILLSVLRIAALWVTEAAIVNRAPATTTSRPIDLKRIMRLALCAVVTAIGAVAIFGMLTSPGGKNMDNAAFWTTCAMLAALWGIFPARRK